jgi:putative pyruvate formate lyase activating enzyme
MLPLYLEKLTLPDLKGRAQKLTELLKDCRICPNECEIDRIQGEKGLCNSDNDVIISSLGPHFGEEPPLVGFMGSGTIFFTNCNLACEYCQNYDTSHYGAGQKINIDHLAEAMLNLQNRGCHNINLVTPTHFTPQIVSSLISAIERGLEIPLVYNCGGYESIETLQLLENIVDIYMPDIKYSSNNNALKYSGIKNYWEIVKEAIKEMYRQVGNLKITKRGIARRGLLVRHLVLPNDIAGSKNIIDFISNEISPETYLNIMDQYRPTFKANQHTTLNRYITDQEYKEVVEYARSKGISKGLEYRKYKRM